MKLQEVYASEQNKVGDWNAIGYKSPAGGTGSDSKSTTNFLYTRTSSEHWKAKSLVGLNDCEKNTEWKIISDYEGATGNVTAQAVFAKQGDGCTVAGLTPNFCKIGNKTGGEGCGSN